MPSDSRHSAATDAAAATLMPVAAMLASMVSLTIGTSFAKGLFPIVGAPGTITFRITIAALLLVAVRRPWRWALNRRIAAAIGIYGLVLGAMNLMFYMALRTIPLGLAIAIEFVGPLAVALAASRKALDLVWIGLALVGLGLLLPLGHGPTSLDPIGIAFALGAAACWGLYIICGQSIGHIAGAQSVSLGMAVAALFVLPFGIASAGRALLDPALILAGTAVAILSSAVPYSLEMVALRHLPRQTFAVLLSLEPAIGSLAALAILGERLGGIEWLAIGCIVLAFAGSALGLHRDRRARSLTPPCPAAP